MRFSLQLLALSFLAYYVVASFTFAVRHPWATKTEQAIYTWDALNFRTVPYREMRPRE